MDDNQQPRKEEELRPRRDATKVTDFRRFHSTGDISDSKQDSEAATGKVAAAVKRIETPQKSEPASDSSAPNRDTGPKSRRALSGNPGSSVTEETHQDTGPAPAPATQET